MNKYFTTCLIFIVGFQAGFLYKCWWDYRHDPIPQASQYDVDKGYAPHG